mmetsp:Transcript_9355/g.14388  ORF Transcript_9355/g.14388 Transcript_9355/m.14388 type:complete len:168 (+) Transcript_9355:691-1194(+)
MAFCFLELGKPTQALTLCDEALNLDPQCAKAHFRRGKALALLDRYNEAKLALDQARICAPQDNIPATKELHKLAATTQRVKQIRTQQRLNFSKALRQGKVYHDKSSTPPWRLRYLQKQKPLNVYDSINFLLQLFGICVWLLATLAVFCTFFYPSLLPSFIFTPINNN